MFIRSRRFNRAQVICVTFLGLYIGWKVGDVLIVTIDQVFRSEVGARKSKSSRVSGTSFTKDSKGQSTGLSDRKSRIEQTEAQMKGHKRVIGEVLEEGDAIHTLCTSNGSPYLNYQTRIMYGTYRIVQQMRGGEKLVAFTRILHRTQPDHLMDEIPTFRANPLSPKCDQWCEFPVSDRPNAVAQFFTAASRDPSLIKAPWLLMLEGDYVWMKPLQAPLAESSDSSWVFPYKYINPEGYPQIMRTMFPESRGPISLIPCSGPAPVMLRLREWKKVIPDWERLTAQIEADPVAKEKLGWVREMYAFSIALALQDIKILLKQNFMAQPPADSLIGDASLLHYTWGTLVEEQNGTKVWIFDKREYTEAIIERKSPKIPLPPPYQSGWKLHEGQPYTENLHLTVTTMLEQMNRAIDQLPLLA